jgi:hypothetical protein
MEQINRGRVVPAIVFAADGDADIGVFTGFYYDTVSYNTDPAKITGLAISVSEALAAIDSLETINSIGNGGVQPRSCMALSIGKVASDTVVYQVVVSDSMAAIILTKLQGAFAQNASAISTIKSFAIPIGAQGGLPPVDLENQVTVRVGGFRQDKSSEVFASRVEVHNTGGSVSGRVILVVQTANGIEVVSEAGRAYRCGLPRGRPYVVVQSAGAFGSNSTRSITLRIRNPDRVSVPIRSVKAFLAAGDP